ncbi:type IV secretion system protein (plasmid) [Asticcacaulis sp. DW145]|uniref:type IV secretion system protein n=1 Tax=Asticcacaulis sp. DW145 TaxID=3095608 RepID=UPI0030874843|nr:type IV secretion system protein [Asticcacaulis sp. DW145]
MRNWTGLVCGAAFLTMAGNVHAQSIVYDPLNTAQAIKQVAAWKQQYDQMVAQYQKLQSQLDQAKTHYNALTGSRNLGDIASNPLLKDIVPAGTADIFKAINTGGFEGLTATAKALRSAGMIYNCEDQEGTQKTACEAALNTIFQAQANQQSTLALLDQRQTQISALQSQINQTQDPKAIAELQARIGVAQAEISNDANRILVMNAMAESQEAQAQQALRERTLKRLSPDAPATAETFVFTMPPTN